MCLLGMIEIILFFCFPFFLKRKFLSRSSRLELFCRKDVLKNFLKFIGKHLCQSLFLNKVADLSLPLYQKRDFGTGVLLWILWNFKKTFSYRTPPAAACLRISNWCVWRKTFWTEDCAFCIEQFERGKVNSKS